MTTPQTAQEQQAYDLEAIRRAALDYAQGWYEGDAERMRRSLHPELAKRAILRDPQTGEERFSHLGRQRMVEITERGGGSEDVPEAARRYEVTILDVCGEIASARADTTEYVDYLHLARSQGQWLIVNVLFLVKENAPTLPPTPA